jgi:hypothetical protein
VKLPSGVTIGQTNNEALRSELIRLGVEGAATAGRNVLAERYAAMVKKIHDTAGDAAVSKWFEERK